MMIPDRTRSARHYAVGGPVATGVLASMFFSITFVINQELGQTGHSWQWTAALRYFFMVPLLYGLLRVSRRSSHDPLRWVLRSRLWTWIWGGTLGFGLFYAPLTFAAQYGPAWMVAGTWQITIVAGGLLEPLLRRRSASSVSRSRVPWHAILYSLIILLGVGMLQFARAQGIGHQVLVVGLPVLLAALAYPVGNRLMLRILPRETTALERTFGMTVGSLPFWLGVALWGQLNYGWPTAGQIVQAGIVALSSGVIATILFYQATGRAYDRPHLLAAVEATQAAEVLFSLAGSILFLHQSWPSPQAILGIIVIIAGMIFHSYYGSIHKHTI